MNLSFVTIHVQEIKATEKFYETVLGFKITRTFSPRPGMFITFMSDAEGNQLEFIQDGKIYSGQGLSLGFNVPDILAVEILLNKNKVEIISGPVKMGNGIQLLNARDLNGLELGFVQS
jgi:lactoylglutathione lyase